MIKQQRTKESGGEKGRKVNNVQKKTLNESEEKN
jgi:hypothetical protein